MSRGDGRVQRVLLKVLRDHDREATPQDAACGLDTIELAARVYFGRGGAVYHDLLSPGYKVAVRRALAGLARSGHIIRLGTFPFRDDRCHWRSGL